MLPTSYVRRRSSNSILGNVLPQRRSESRSRRHRSVIRSGWLAITSPCSTPGSLKVGAIFARTFDQKVGFSNGCVQLGPKNPPPFVPSCLIATNAATGPREIVCVAPSRVVATAAPSSVIGIPSPAKQLAQTNDIGSKINPVARQTSW